MIVTTQGHIVVLEALRLISCADVIHELAERVTLGGNLITAAERANARVEELNEEELLDDPHRWVWRAELEVDDAEVTYVTTTGRTRVVFHRDGRASLTRYVIDGSRWHAERPSAQWLVGAGGVVTASSGEEKDRLGLVELLGDPLAGEEDPDDRHRLRDLARARSARGWHSGKGGRGQRPDGNRSRAARERALERRRGRSEKEARFA
jgi:hypothetical protein